jgi:hypothetical protein
LIVIPALPYVAERVRALPGEFYLRAEVADALGVSPSTLRRLGAKNTQLAPTRIVHVRRDRGAGVRRGRCGPVCTATLPSAGLSAAARGCGPMRSGALAAPPTALSGIGAAGPRNYVPAVAHAEADRL